MGSAFQGNILTADSLTGIFYPQSSGLYNTNQINSLSGFLINNTLTGATVTGSATMVGNVNFVPAGDIKLYYSGQNIVISGSAGAAGGGEANTASNLGIGSGIFAQKAGVDLQFKSFSVSDNLEITGDANRLNIRLTGVALNVNTGDFATISQINNTGSSLLNTIYGLSGQFNISGDLLEGKINTVSNAVSNALSVANAASNAASIVSAQAQAISVDLVSAKKVATLYGMSFDGAEWTA